MARYVNTCMYIMSMCKLIALHTGTHTLSYTHTHAYASLPGVPAPKESNPVD